MLSPLCGAHSEFRRFMMLTLWAVFCKLPRFYRIAWYHAPQESCCHISFLFSSLSFFSSFFLSSSVSISLLHVQEQVCIIQGKEVIKSLAVCIAYGCDCTSITKYCEYIVIGLETWALGGWGRLGCGISFFFCDGYQATKSAAADISLRHKMITGKHSQ